MNMLQRMGQHLKERLSPSTIAREMGQTIKEQAAAGAAELHQNLQAFPQQAAPQMAGPEAYARSQAPQQKAMER